MIKLKNGEKYFIWINEFLELPAQEFHHTKGATM